MLLTRVLNYDLGKGKASLKNYPISPLLPIYTASRATAEGGGTTALLLWFESEISQRSMRLNTWSQLVALFSKAEEH